jgi:hypothetical protein
MNQEDEAEVEDKGEIEEALSPMTPTQPNHLIILPTWWDFLRILLDSNPHLHPGHRSTQSQEHRSQDRHQQSKRYLLLSRKFGPAPLRSTYNGALHRSKMSWGVHQPSKVSSTLLEWKRNRTEMGFTLIEAVGMIAEADTMKNVKTEREKKGCMDIQED